MLAEGPDAVSSPDNGSAYVSMIHAGTTIIDADTQPSATNRRSAEPTCLGPTTNYRERVPVRCARHHLLDRDRRRRPGRNRHPRLSLVLGGSLLGGATVTTVGYGDIVLSTVARRVVEIVLMFVGIGFLAVLTPMIASQFVKTDRATEASAVVDSLARLEAEFADLKRRLAAGR
jgi:hypothetical protein